MNQIKYFLVKIFATTYFQPFFKALYFFSLKGMNYGSAISPTYSGEIALFKQLKNELDENPILFDVGANNGQYLEILIEQLKNLNPQIHVFEPDEYAFETLKRKYSNNHQIVLNNFALGDENGNKELYFKRSGGVHSSLVLSNKGDFQIKFVQVKKLDDYCLEHKIGKISFMKIDVEGYEMNVLKGSIHMLKSANIERIQLEHGNLESIIMKSSLYSFFQILSNYTCYHLKQNGPYKITYSPKWEIYYNSNYYFKLKP